MSLWDVTLTAAGAPVELPVSDGDNVLLLVRKGAVTVGDDAAAHALMRRLLAAPLFASLRTKQQLGYAISSGARNVSWGASLWNRGGGVSK